MRIARAAHESESPQRRPGALSRPTYPERERRVKRSAPGRARRSIPAVEPDAGAGAREVLGWWPWRALRWHSSPSFGDLERHRRELTGYCYRMLGSPFEAEDAVQDTLLRAWRALERFEGRASVRSWLYRIATNVCLDMLSGSRAPRAPDGPRPLALPGRPDRRDPPRGDVDRAGSRRAACCRRATPPPSPSARETLRLAFVAALQHLPPRQRAVLILFEVLDWRPAEVAELLDTSVAAVNSALQRARATLEQARRGRRRQRALERGTIDELLARYVDAFERYDMDALTTLIHEDATQSMPPYELWLTGREDILGWWVGPGAGCRGSRVIPTIAANGSPAFAQYKPSETRRGLRRRGRCRCSRWQTGGSSSSRSSSPPRRSSRCSGLPPLPPS